MGKLSRFCPHIVVSLLVAGLMAACGSKNNSNTMVSTVNPSAFYSHAVALQNFSTLYIWGANSLGQLGDGDPTGTSKYVPAPLVYNLKYFHVAGVSAGGTHTLAFQSNGDVYAWGNNGFGQLGNASQILVSIPNYVGALTEHVIGVAAGGYHSLALGQSGDIWSWGNNGNGQLGDGTTNMRLAPVNVLDSVNGSPLQHVTKIAAGGSHSLAIAGTNATAYAWGYNGFGQLGQPSQNFGNYSTSTDFHYPVPVVKASDGTSLTNVIDITAGGSHSLFVTSDGNLWACGYDGLGQLGLGDYLDRNHGVAQVMANSTTPFSNVKQVAAGLDHTLALLNDGTVWAWGYNFSGQLGSGGEIATIFSLVNRPVKVIKSDGTQLGTKEKIKKIIAIGNSSYAVDTSGQLWAWGDNTFGQLGLGNVVNQNVATSLSTMPSNTDLYHP